MSVVWDGVRLTPAAFGKISRQPNKSLQVSCDCVSFIKSLISQIVATRAATQTLCRSHRSSRYLRLYFLRWR